MVELHSLISYETHFSRQILIKANNYNNVFSAWHRRSVFHVQPLLLVTCKLQNKTPNVVENVFQVYEIMIASQYDIMFL